MNEEMKIRLVDFVKKYSIYIIILAIAFIGWIAFAPEKKGKPQTTPVDNSQYVSELENKLEGIVTTISGSDKVEVMITLASQSKQVLAIDEKTTTNTEIEKSDKMEKQTEVAVVNGSPIIIEEELPKISGVCVVYTGVGNKDDIKSAIATVLGIREGKVAVVQK